MTHTRTSLPARRYHPMRLLAALSCGAGLVLALGAAAPPGAPAATHLIAGARVAASSGTWTVTPGGTSSAGGVGRLHLTDTKTGAIYICSSSMSLIFKTGSGLPGRDIASVTSVLDAPCGGFKVTAGNLPWAVNAQRYFPATGLTTGTVSRLTLSFSGGGCHFTVGNPTATSQVRVSYANGTGGLHLLAAGGNLQFFGVSGCPGSGNGDPATINANYRLTPVQTVTSQATTGSRRFR